MSKKTLGHILHEGGENFFKSPSLNPLPDKMDSLYDIGKVPPSALDMEEAVLGALLINGEVYDDVASIIRGPQVFYKDAHQLIYKAIETLVNNDKKVDILTVTEQLRVTQELEEAGGPYYVTRLTERIASSANAMAHAQIVVQKFIQREIIRIGSELKNRGYDDSIDIIDLIDYGEKEISGVLEGITDPGVVHVSGIVKENMDIIDSLRENKNEIRGIPTGFEGHDKLIYGLQDTDLIILASRPAMGKSSLALNITRNVAIKNSIPVLLFSLEMGKRQLEMRLKIDLSEVEGSKVFTGRLKNTEYNDIVQANELIKEAPLYIDDTPSLNIIQLKRKTKKAIKDYGIRLVIVDYLQLMTGVGKFRAESRETEVGNISRGLKAIAKEFNIPILALAQLNRQSELRTDRRPRLSDLRESGSLEQDADSVWLLWRPWQAGIKENESHNSTFGEAWIIVAKHRNGPTGENRYGFQSRFIRFVDWSKMEPIDYNEPSVNIHDDIDFSDEQPKISDQQTKAPF